MAGTAEMIIELDKKRMAAMAQKDVAALTWRMVTWQSTKLPD